MEFICGVVEGFYGTPWRCSERKDLFSRLKDLGLNTYMYAPKDDAKHRKDWREKYKTVEIEMLKDLINACKTNSIEFVYSISPGLDIVFSSPTDVSGLKEKLQQEQGNSQDVDVKNQVYDIGCRSFALLFDDIDPELCLADKLEFTSSADAQVKTTNKVLEWFESINYLLFCPTEYCTTRAKPDTESSEYLTTLGKGLHEKVHIMWTGPKVISKTIDCSSLQSLTKVLKRKPLIWDNIHANDYDHRRVFLGPFKGRSVDLYENTSGLLTNPNCEYECNHIAIHSLSTWLERAKNIHYEHKKDGKDEEISDITTDCSLYDTDEALIKAVESWMRVFHLITDTVQDINMKSSQKLALGLNVNSLLHEDFTKKCNTLNSGVVDDAKNGEDKEEIPANKNDNIIGDENMEIATAECPTKISDVDISEQTCTSDDDVSPKKKAKSSEITFDDVLLLCDLFHLPYEHGKRGLQIISEFKWLKENAIDFKKNAGDQTLMDGWICRSNNFKSLCKNVEDMFTRLQDISNRRLLQQLYPYVYDVKEAVKHLEMFIKWLGSNEREKRKTYLPADPEAWFFRGGIVEEMERLLPRPDTASNETQASTTTVPKIQVTTIRPYIKQDRTKLYKLCSNLCKEYNYTLEDLAGDRKNIYYLETLTSKFSMIGAYLEYSAEMTLVAEMNDDICGFVVANKNLVELKEKIETEWNTKMKSKYPLSSNVPSTWSIQDEAINRLHNYTITTPDEISKTYNAILKMGLGDKIRQIAIVERLLQCCTNQLKTNIYCEITPNEKLLDEQYYTAAAFQPIELHHLHTNKNLFFGYIYE